MKRVLFLLMLLPLAFGMDTTQVSFMHVIYNYSGSISNGSILLHVPPADGIQSYGQITANDISDDSIGIFINATGSFAYSSEIKVNTSLVQIKSNPTIPISGYESFKSPTLFIDSNNSAIIQKALEIVGTENKELDLISKVLEWNFENIEYDSSSVSLPKRKASDVLAEGSGVCGDISVSTAAMLRSLGIPVKYVAGYLMLSKDSFQAHAWLEVYVPETGWVSIDPTNGQFMITANHIKLYSSADPSELGDTLFYSGVSPYDKGRASITIVSSLNFPSIVPYSVIDKENLGIGSVFDMMVYLKNENPYYVIPDLTVDSSSGITTNSAHRIIVIAPFSEKAAQFSFRVSENLSSEYMYTFFMVTEGPGFSFTRNVTVEGISSDKVQKFRIKDISMQQQGANVVIDVVVENYGNEVLNTDIVSSNSFFRDQQKLLSVLPGEIKHVTFSYPILLNASNYSFEVSIASDGYRVSKTVLFVTQKGSNSGLNYLNAFIAAVIIIVSTANVIIYWPALNKRYFKGVKSKQKIPKNQVTVRKYEKHLDKHKISNSMEFLSHLDKEKKIDDDKHTIEELKGRRSRK